MIILAIESSCDETSAAVVRSESAAKGTVLSNIIASQADIHALYGGVVPEIAGRAHIQAISRVTYQALAAAGISVEETDAIAVTSEPGLIGALLVGVNFAKSLAYSYNKPLVAVNHIKGHIAANYLSDNPPAPPFFAFVISGGHTSLISVRDYNDMHTVGSTRDDAIGEAFDKVGRVMGLSYPCGGEMDRLACLGKCDAVRLPSAAIAGDTLDFSFSGLKTAVVNYLNTVRQKGGEICREDVAASFTHTVCTSVVKKLSAAYERYAFHTLVLAGGVAANSHLRRAVEEFCSEKGVRVHMPPLSLCGDNAAMIAAAAVYEIQNKAYASTSLNAKASTDL